MYWRRPQRFMVTFLNSPRFCHSRIGHELLVDDVAVIELPTIPRRPAGCRSSSSATFRPGWRAPSWRNQAPPFCGSRALSAVPSRRGSIDAGPGVRSLRVLSSDSRRMVPATGRRDAWAGPVPGAGSTPSGVCGTVRFIRLHELNFVTRRDRVDQRQARDAGWNGIAVAGRPAESTTGQTELGAKGSNQLGRIPFLPPHG